MLVLIAVVMVALTSWIALRMLRWEKEDEVKEIKEDREIE